ncbi:hypothetical protein C7H19_03075 [Aphanothece hegewaldii CCALA 016]|uniref:SGNH/GDSL hydrolase family protein n=1 Tax=Aphanothece hegewaldii CCALA 016 TaxID=2107694 RepID=A0A2T1M2S1_9CHRO|nr:hypothetical protein [Aphanothece hegewaldii]PSF39049.1 hypothetical protein C7H19_03075 [Aphanothece hegewaldii CCALA 016]
MNKTNISKLFPWLISAGVAWTIGCIYNVYYGGELSWLRRMYEQKAAYAAQIEAPNRLIITAGSGVHYSVNAEWMEKKLGIPVFNYGLQGDMGLNVIKPLILEQARKGDIIVLIPEYLMLMDKDGLGDGDGLYGSAPFGWAVGQPGLGGIPPKKLIEDTWLLGVTTLRAATKSTIDVIEKGRMTGYLSDPITEHGDPTKVKERTGKWWELKLNNSVSPHSIKVIEQFRKDLEAKGAHLIVALPWIYGSTDQTTKDSIQKSADKLSQVVPTLYNHQTLNIQTDSSIFADTHYHLLPPARIVRSQELIDQLKPYLAEYIKQPELQTKK